MLPCDLTREDSVSLEDLMALMEKGCFPYGLRYETCALHSTWSACTAEAKAPAGRLLSACWALRITAEGLKKWVDRCSQL